MRTPKQIVNSTQTIEVTIADWQQASGLLAAILIFVLTLAFTPLTLDSFLPLKETIFFAFALLCALLFFLFMRYFPQQIIPITWADVLVFLWIILGSFSVLWSVNPLLSANGAVYLLASGFYWVLFRSMGKAGYSIFRFGIILTMFPLIFYGTLQFFHWDVFFGDTSELGISRLFSTLGNRNYFAYSLGSMLFALFIAVIAARRHVKLLQLLFAFAVTLFFLPGTRGALLAFFLISPLFLYHCIQQFGVKRVIQRLKIPLVLSIILLLVVFLIMGKTADPIGRIFSLTQNDTNVHMRQEIFSTALSIFQKNKWFGTGLNTFSVEFLAEKEKLLETGIESDFQIHVPRVHNDLLQVLSELGIIGFLPILILLIILVSQIRYFREEGFIFLFIFLSSMVSFPFQMHVTALLAIATCARLSNQLQPVISCPIPPFQKYLISLILLGFSIFCLYLIPFRLASATATRLAGQNFNLGNLNATVLYKKALSWNPNNEFARFRLGIAEMDTGNYENAVTHFNQLHTRRNDPGVLYNKALSLFLLGDLENARQLFNRLLFISAKPDLVWMNLGNVLDKQAKYRQALRCFITSMELNPTEMTFLNLLRTAKKINIEKLLPFFAEKWSLIQSPTLRIRLIEVYRQHQMGDAADKLEKLFHGGNSGYLYSKRITKKNP